MNTLNDFNWKKFKLSYGFLFVVYMILSLTVIEQFEESGLVFALALLLSGIMTLLMPPDHVKQQVYILLVLGLLSMVIGSVLIRDEYSAIVFVFLVCLLAPVLEWDIFGQVTSLLLQIWAVSLTVLLVRSTDHSMILYPFMLGCGLTLLWAFVKTWLGGNTGQFSMLPNTGWPDRSGRWYALLRAAAIATSVFLGHTLFPNYSLWVSITVLVVLQPGSRQTMIKSLHRALGTIAGICIVLPVLAYFNQSIELLLAIIAFGGFMMFASLYVNYALVIFFATGVVIALQVFIERDSFDAGWQRILATLSGIAIALLVIAVTRILRLDDRQQQPSMDPPTV